MQIQPREIVTLVRGLEDHADSTTYYVRAVVRNARTDALIETVDLVDNGDRRFTYPWQAPADVSGDGLYIVVTYTVYTDSGYTTKAENYGEKFDEHLIQARLTPAMMGGPGGPDIDYKKIQKMIDTAIVNINFPISKPISLAEVEKALHQVLLEVRQIDIPEVRPTDLDPVIQLIGQAKKDLTAVILERPRFEKTDLNPLIKQIENLITKFNTTTEKEELSGILERIRTFFDGDIESIKTEIKSITEILNSMPYITLQGGKGKQNE